MELPFSYAAFLDVFGAYNKAFLPAVALLWVVTAGLLVRWLFTGGRADRDLWTLLSLHWAWSGVSYHWLFFRRINPAATFFAALFVLQAVFFAWLASSSRGRFPIAMNLRGVMSGALVVCGLAYPAVGLVFGLRYPRVPLFGVPCPTTLLTAGLLLSSTGVTRLVNVLPIIWAIIGSSAAFALGIRADLALVVAGALLVFDTLAPAVLGVRGAGAPQAR